MTAQIQDCIVYQGEGYAIIGIKGEGLLRSSDYGMTPTIMHTACYRGVTVPRRSLTISGDGANTRPIS